MVEATKEYTADYDIFAREYIKNPFPIWDEIRGSSARSRIRTAGAARGCRRATRTSSTSRATSSTSRRATCWSPPSCRRRTRSSEELSEEDQELIQQYNVGAPPITSDPPVHTWARKLLLPPFSVTSVEKYEQETRELCNELIDGFIDDGQADGAADYAQQIPPRVIASMLGIPKEETATFTEWVRGFLELGLTNPELREESATQHLRVHDRAGRSSARQNPGRRPDQLPAGAEGRRRAGAGAARARHLLPDPRRRHRHDVELHRLRDLAPRAAPGAPQAPHRRAGAHRRTRSRSCCARTRR